MRVKTIILFLFISNFALAQRSGFIKLKQQKYKEAAEIFHFILEEQKNNSASYFGLSKLYSTENYTNSDYEKALAYADSSLTYFNLLSAENKKEFADIFTQDSLVFNFNKLENINFASAKAKDKKAIENFLLKYPKTKYKTEAEKILQIYKELQTIESKNLVEAYNDFLKKHPNFPGNKFAETKRNKLAFAEAKKINSAKAYTYFIQKYPNAIEIEQAYLERIRCDSIVPIVASFRGNETRNYYGKNAPSELNLVWKLHLGSGQSKVKGHPKVWAGAGWTGQPLLIEEKGIAYLIQGAYDYNLRKIEAKTGKVIWQYKYDDIIKGTATFWINKKADKLEERYILMQGSRYGQNLSIDDSKIVPSFRAISYISGKELWRMNSVKTLSYSRDVDGSALVVNDTAYIGLENGLFTIFDPNPTNAEDTLGIHQPNIFSQTWLYRKRDYVENSSNLVTESSPTLLNNRVFLTSGSGHVYGYNLKTKKLDWDYYIGSDIDGTAVVSNDNKLLVSIEKEFIKGQGGVFKIDPEKKSKDCVDWFFPTQNRNFGEWEGGIIGTVATNEMSKSEIKYPSMVAFVGIDGWLYVVNSNELEKGKTVNSPNLDKQLKTPKLIFKYKVNPSISSPIFAENKLIVGSTTGLYLFEFDEKGDFKLKSSKLGRNFEASPIVWNKRVYIASRDGYLYCYGTKQQ